MGFYLKRSETEYSDYMPRAQSKPTDRPDGTWTEGEPEGLIVYQVQSLQDRIKDAFASYEYLFSGVDRLPWDIRQQLCDLEMYLKMYSQRNVIEAIQSEIQSFSIGSKRKDVSPSQRTSVEGLKADLLVLLM